MEGISCAKTLALRRLSGCTWAPEGGEIGLLSLGSKALSALFRVPSLRQAQGDSCSFTQVECILDEVPSRKQFYPRWFESATGTKLLEVTKARQRAETGCRKPDSSSFGQFRCESRRSESLRSPSWRPSCHSAQKSCVSGSEEELRRPSGHRTGPELKKRCLQAHLRGLFAAGHPQHCAPAEPPGHLRI